jgi:hypothetical protein
VFEALRSPSAAARERALADVLALGLVPNSPVVLCLLGQASHDGDPLAVARQAARRLSAGYGVVGATPEGAGLLAALSDPVLRTLPSENVAAWLHSISPDVAVGQSGVLALNAIHEAARQAAIALRVAWSRPAGTTFAAWSTLGADRLVAQLPSVARSDVPEGLVRLLHEEHTLVTTLAAFLDAGGDVKATAAALSLHRSGLYYRLGRIEELTGLNMSSGDDRLLAHLAIRTEQLS